MAEEMAPEVEKDIAYYRRTWGFDDTTVRVLRHMLKECVTDDYPPKINKEGYSKEEIKQALSMDTKDLDKAFDALVAHGIIIIAREARSWDGPGMKKMWTLSENIIMNLTAVNAKKDKMEKELGMKPPVKA